MCVPFLSQSRPGLSIPLSLSPTSSGIKVVSVVATNNNTLSNSRRSEDLFSCSYPWSRRTIRRPRFFTSPVLKSSKRMLTAESILFHLDQLGCFFHVKEKLKLTSPAFFSRKNGALCVLYFFVEVPRRCNMKWGTELNIGIRLRSVLFSRHFSSKFYGIADSVTRLGDFLHFGQSFKADASNYFAQIAQIVRQFLLRCQNHSFF